MYHSANLGTVRHLLPLVLCLGLGSGCAQTAVLQSWQPAECNVAGIRCVAVQEFSGPEGDSVTQALKDRLRENQFYSLVDVRELSPTTSARFSGHSATAKPDLLLAAKNAEVDAVVTGEVLTFACRDRKASVVAGRWGWPLEPHGRSSSEEMIREGTVTLAVRLVDAETGAVRASRKISKQQIIQPASGDGEPSDPEQILDKLLAECLDESVALLAPHCVEFAVPLASGNYFCRMRGRLLAGNRWARRGDWDHAEQEWQSVLELHPGHDAALFNLAMAAAQRHDFTAAESLAMDALKVRHSPQYARGLEQIRSQRSAFLKTTAQRDASQASPWTTAWN